jgi:hypothetical protein
MRTLGGPHLFNVILEIFLCKESHRKSKLKLMVV